MNKSEIGFDGEFRRVIEDRCDNYTILTSINGFIYRVEIYSGGQLLDGAEADIGALVASSRDDTVFVKHYTEAHKNFMKKYCKNQKESQFEYIDEGEVDHHSIDRNTYTKLSFFSTHLKKKINKRNISIAIFSLFLLLVILLFRPVACNDSIVGIFIGDNNLLEYHKNTESMCHKLEDHCKILANTNLDQISLEESEKCRSWCKSGRIENNRCVLFLSLLPKEEHKKGPSGTLQISKPLPPVVKKEPYIFLPDKKIELKLGKHYPIKIANQSNMDIKVKLINLVLRKSIHEEIVQFEDGNIEIDIEPNKEGSFGIYLEPTYYEQFQKNSYVGKMVFTIYFSDGKEDNKTVLLTFRVK